MAPVIVLGYALLPPVTAPCPDGALWTSAQWGSRWRTRFAVHLARLRPAHLEDPDATERPDEQRFRWRSAAVFFGTATSVPATGRARLLAVIGALPVAGVIVPAPHHPRRECGPAIARRDLTHLLAPVRVITLR
jgi:hypothetical protein